MAPMKFPPDFLDEIRARRANLSGEPARHPLDALEVKWKRDA
jgi:hypothetical protein